MRICAVSYLNTRPFLFGLEQIFQPGDMEIETRVPSACATAFAREEADLALVPVATLPELKYDGILPNWCIGADGQVDSVFICAQEEIHQIHTLVQDQHSRTSNLLSAVLLQNHWKNKARIIPARDGAWENPEAGTAYVIIGDKAVQARKSFRYVYDLAAEWKAYSGLPFVFAVWVYKGLSQDQINRIDRAFGLGMQALRQVADLSGPEFGMTPEQAYHYYTQSLSYTLDSAKQEAIQRYLTEGARIALPVL
ncbi:MAG: menaquinone biosynthesis protein [Bacteroidia bacterium]|nr:menaquinone biosynthesis protein [Bacteroidia bacterium]